jgi:short-subunit dehydrogenase
MGRFVERYGPWAIVTGASAGIGRALAVEIARRKVNVVAIARRQHLLDALKSELESQFGVEVRAVGVDLTAPDAMARIDQATRGITIGLVVPAAGVAFAGEFSRMPSEQLGAMAILNVAVPMQVIRHFAPRMLERRRGGVLLIASLFAYQGIPYVASYAATKAYVLLLGEALHVELGRGGVDVTVLSPGLTATDMPAGMPIDFSKLPMPTQSAATVARTGIRALGRKVATVSGVINKFYAWQNRLVPRSVPVSLFGFLIRRAMKPRPE